MTTPTPSRGVCRVCGRPYKLTGKGLVRRHWARQDDGKAAPGLVDCSGSQREPAALRARAEDGQP